MISNCSFDGHISVYSLLGGGLPPNTPTQKITTGVFIKQCIFWNSGFKTLFFLILMYMISILKLFDKLHFYYVFL